MQGYQHTLRRNSKPAVFLLLVIHCICSCASQAECVGATSRLFADTTRGCLQQTPSAAKEHPTQPTVQSSAQTVKQQAAAAGGASALIGSQGVSVRRHLLQSAHPSSANGRARLDHWSHNTTWAQKYANGSCFPSGRVLQAANIKDLIRLVTDPTVSQIQLVGDIVLTHDLFPPEESYDQTKGVTISSKVEIRACTSRESPIIVDCNHVYSQFFVDGIMTWRGTIKFINSYPSLRRAGLWELISPLHIEKAGQLHFQGVHVHGYEPTPLFNEEDPYWEVHNDSRFAPQPSNYERLNLTAMMMKTWLFNKTAWLLHSQGANGVIRSTGDGFWLFKDVLLTYQPNQSTARRRAVPVLAVALPVVFGVLLLACGSVLAWWCMRKRERSTPWFPGKPSQSTPIIRPPLRSVNSAGLPESPRGSTNSFSGLSSSVTGVESSGISTTTKEIIEATRQRMRQVSELPEGALVLQRLLGEGTFGKVHSAMWKGTLVAVKTTLLPVAMSGKARREKMAIMETAISSSLSHPNIVQTYTYEVKALTGQLSHKGSTAEGLSSTGGSSAAVSSDVGNRSSIDCHGWKVRLVLELCDLGTLQEFLVKGGFKRPTGQYDMAGLIATAQDVARAMHHLHSENIIHGDLKARNVLLKSAAANTKMSAGGDARGFVAKLSDFGLSTAMGPTETHISNLYQGTLNHMAPEVLMYGKISFASDVYAYGIMLYEMYTASQAYKGVPKVLLGHEVAKVGRRPEFPPDCPFDFQLLACRCWESDPAIRPTFEQILSTLQSMTKRLQDADGASSQSGGLSTPSSCSSTQPTPMQGHLGHPRNAARLRTAPTPAAVPTAAAAVVLAKQDDPNKTAGSAPLPHNPAPQGGSIITVSGLNGRHAGMPVSAQRAGELELAQQRQLVDVAQLQDNAAIVGESARVQLTDLQQHRVGSSSSSSHSSRSGQQQQMQPPGITGAHVAVGTGAPAPAAVVAAASADVTFESQLQPAVSLGTWDGDDVWLCDSLAPVKQPVQPPVAPAQPALSALQPPPPQQQPRGQQVLGREMPGVPGADSATKDAGVGVPNEAHASQLQRGVSLGTWDGDGLWLSGSLAPVEPQQHHGMVLGQVLVSTAQQRQQRGALSSTPIYDSDVAAVGITGPGKAPAQLQRGVSLGTWDGDGLWLSGSLAPLEVQGHIQV